MPPFQLVSDFQPTGDQPQAIAQLAEGIAHGDRYQTLLGVTGSGKTFIMANIIQATQRPTLVMAHNKTLAAQLYSEFKEFFPHNAVEYFVSYYDYYQPEAYIPRTDTYIEKDARSTTRSSACGCRPPRRSFRGAMSSSSLRFRASMPWAIPRPTGRWWSISRWASCTSRDRMLRHLVSIFYERNDAVLSPGKFRVRGDTMEIMPAYAQTVYRIEFWGDEIERIVEVDALTGELLSEQRAIQIFPAKHYITPQDRMDESLKRHRGRAGRAPQGAARAGKAVGGAAPGAAHALRSRDAARGGQLFRRRELFAASVAAPARRRALDAAGLFPRRHAVLYRRVAHDGAADSRACITATARAKRCWSIMAFACRRRWTTAR